MGSCTAQLVPFDNADHSYGALPLFNALEFLATDGHTSRVLIESNNHV